VGLNPEISRQPLSPRSVYNEYSQAKCAFNEKIFARRPQNMVKNGLKDIGSATNTEKPGQLE